MKKFFTLCLAFMLASLLNMNAADTYTLVGENINGKSWDVGATENDLVYDASTDSYSISGVTMSGKFKIAKDHAWTTAWGNNEGAKIPIGAAYIAWVGSNDIELCDAQTYNNCTVTFKILNTNAASIRITSSTPMQAAIDTRADAWCVAGTFSDNEWNDAYEMTDLGNGVYELWSTELPSEFKFKAKGDWSISFGMNGDIKNTPIMGFDNALKDNGGNISLATDQVYDKYRYTLTVRGMVASFRVDGYKEAVPSLTRVFYESFDKNTGAGGNDNTWSNISVQTELIPDNNGWTYEKGYGASKCARFGTSSALGTITSPALGVTGNAELRFKAGAWNNDSKTLTITINNGGTLSVSSVTLVNNAFTDYTISISDATPESTITFSAAKASKNRFFLDEVEVYANSSELSAAGITLTGVMKDTETAYYHHTLANPTVTVTLPAGATYMDVEIENSGWVNPDISPKNQTSDCTIPFYNAGNYTVRVTAYGEGVYSVASKDIAIETVSSVYTFDELINKGEGATCYLNFSPTVVAHIGKYLYLEGYDMWDGIRSSALVYASLDKTYKKGDVLQGFIATVSYYKGNPQLIPLTTSLGEPYSYSEPYVYEVEAGDAWTAFAVEANVNKYVRVKNAPVTANPDAVDGVAAYTKNLGVNMPDDVTKKYDVEGFINNFNGTIQIQPISFTAIEEEIVDPNTYTLEINANPANGSKLTALDKISLSAADASVIAMPTTEAQSAGWFTITDANGNTYNYTAKVGVGLDLTIEGATASGTYTVVVPAKTFVDAMTMNAESKNYNAEMTLTYTVEADPFTYTYGLSAIDPAEGEVESLGNQIFITASGDWFEYTTKAYGTTNWIKLVDDKGKVYTTGVGYVTDTQAVVYVMDDNNDKPFVITEPGTYTMTIPQGTFGDRTYYESNYKKGNLNPELVYTWTIKAAALAAPTVDPANGAEVENLNTITLTFAEAVTANAEAGAITIVNTSDAGSDYAKDIKVAISEDGLTATITCVPGYLDRWALGKIYKLNIPAGYFVATSGAASEALEYSWTIAAPKFTYVAVDPAQGEVTELSEILISFAQRIWGYGSNPTLNLVDADGNVVTTASTVRSTDANGNWFAIKATLKDKVTTPGTYTLVVPENSFTDVDFGDSGNKNAAFDLTWTVMEPDPNTYNFAWNVNPAEGTVEELKTIVFTAATAGQMLMPTTEAQVANWVKVTDQNGNVYNTTAKAGTGYDVTIEGATAPGTYTVVVPKASFYDLMASMSNPNSKNFNDEIVLTYTVEAAPAVEDYTPVVTPAAGDITVDQMDVTVITFESPIASFDPGYVKYIKSIGSVWFDGVGEYTISEDKLTLTLNWNLVKGNYPVGSSYTLELPAGCIVLENGAKNLETHINYTIVAPIPDDFTPVINPTAGNITVDQMNVTVISVDSPIVSFDPGYVKYIKSIGNVWLETMGEYTISEDKLTLTLNWNLVKGNYPPGTSYTLELPAGCIVLENGAKNLLTQVVYTIVAGPKDLAEFVVPAGINGYINYDETDVNAWAPEFPFTVSTTAYNTVAFTAELPSLPAGITAMEVIDENGEVIAVLNQDGVAPLADGEIYYVKGETTKEYVDGAELKFRFRFTHLGVSETIQFSYIIAGGNITSIADVELDGNVIVRGNDIIAPEGAAIFTVSGIRVPAEGLAPGVYVVVLGNQAVKVMVK